MNVRLLALAQLDALDLADWYDQQTTGLGTRSLSAVDRLIATLASHPHLYARVSRAPAGREIRRAMVPRFPVVAVYEVRPNEVLVVSLTHARSIRRPWRRLPDPPGS